MTVVSSLYFILFDRESRVTETETEDNGEEKLHRIK